jgi:uncharacterized protein YneF (UPF0154 family)
MNLGRAGLEIKALIVLGFCFGAPLLLGSLLMLVVGVPLGVWIRHKEMKRER